MVVTSSPGVSRAYGPDPTYQKICAAQRSLRHILTSETPSEFQMASFKRKLIGLGIHFVSLEDAQTSLSDYLKDYLSQQQKKALKLWREKVATWTTSARQLYRYVQNPEPSKSFALKGDFGVTNVPTRMYASLQEYWGSVESWPTPHSLEFALSAAEELYGMFLPHHPVEICVTPQKLCDAVRNMKNSSPGLDGWSVAELKALPFQAWQHLTRLMNSPNWNPGASLLGAFRRVPLQKVSGFPRASEIKTTRHLLNFG